jgi:branched-chain amino acid transport system substrate-binding protein
MAHRIGRRGALGGAVAASLPLADLRRASAQRTSTIRIGVLTELSGPNSVATGQGSVLATRMAMQDFMRTNPGLTVEVMEADHQTKADIAVSIAREWLDRADVDCITCLNNSAVALAVAGLVRERDRVALLTGPASSDLTGKACSPNHVHWTYDTWSLGNGTGRALVAEGGTPGSSLPPTIPLVGC